MARTPIAQEHFAIAQWVQNGTIEWCRFLYLVSYKDFVHLLNIAKLCILIIKCDVQGVGKAHITFVTLQLTACYVMSCK